MGTIPPTRSETTVMFPGCGCTIVAILFIIAFAVIFPPGCPQTDHARKLIPVGTVVSTRMAPTNFNEAVKCEVTTTEGTFIVWGAFSAIKGKPANLVIFESGRVYLDVQDNPYHPVVLGY